MVDTEVTTLGFAGYAPYNIENIPGDCKMQIREDLISTRRAALTALAGAPLAVMAQQAGAQENQAIYGAFQKRNLLVVAEWTVEPANLLKVSEILAQYLPQAQRDPGVKLFLISQGTEDKTKFLFYELFADEAAYAAHQKRAFFQSLIIEQGLPLVTKRVRTQYALIS